MGSHGRTERRLLAAGPVTDPPGMLCWRLYRRIGNMLVGVRLHLGNGDHQPIGSPHADHTRSANRPEQGRDGR